MFQAGQPSTLHHGPAFAGPAGGGFQTGHRALELGEYVAGHQLVAVQDLFPGGPIRYPDHQAAEPAADLLEPVDAGYGVVGRADYP